MALRTSSAIALLLLGACGDAGRSPEVTQDHSEIVEAVLLAQPDLAEQHRKFVAEYPDQGSMLDSILDYRLCVSPETAGQSGDFERTDWDANEVPPDFGFYGKRWERSQFREEIPGQLLPEHLRWDSFASYCPSGVLRLGNPTIDGDEARVYVENACSGWCGWGGEIFLKRVKGRWIVDREANWWQS